ncbi:mCG1049144, partial [Mus musculus]
KPGPQPLPGASVSVLPATVWGLHCVGSASQKHIPCVSLQDTSSGETKSEVPLAFYSLMGWIQKSCCGLSGFRKRRLTNKTKTQEADCHLPQMSWKVR